MVLTESISQNHRPPILWIFLFWVIACLIALSSLGNLPLRDFDEATVARVALELSEKVGLDRLLPTLWDQPYLNKPPGLHWIISLAIGTSKNFHTNFESLPSEFCIRFFPALLSTFVVPLGGLIQWNLRPKDRLSSIGTSAILLTLLPVVRHGRMAMLDGTQLSAIALLWFCLTSIKNNKSNKFKFLGAGFACSFMLLLKAPLMIPALLACLIPLIWETKFKNISNRFSLEWFLYGLTPGLTWHLWNILAYGKGALWLWWGDGAGRVLFEKGSGSQLAVLIPIIEILEGGWPWILLWPVGFLWACFSLNTRWGVWAFSTQLIIAASIFPLKMQLPWYSLPLWLPFALLCAPPLSWLIERKNNDSLGFDKTLRKIPYLLSLLGLGLFVFSFLVLVDFFPFAKPYLILLFTIGLGWFIGGFLLSNSRENIRKVGFFAIVLSNLIGLLFLVSSDFWLWEINENWDVRPVAELISDFHNDEIFIKNSFERPSLNWYAQKKIRRFEDQDHEKCILIKANTEWELYSCNN